MEYVYDSCVWHRTMEWHIEWSSLSLSGTPVIVLVMEIPLNRKLCSRRGTNPFLVPNVSFSLRLQMFKSHVNFGMYVV